MPLELLHQRRREMLKLFVGPRNYALLCFCIKNLLYFKSPTALFSESFILRIKLCISIGQRRAGEESAKIPWLDSTFMNANHLEGC